ncbi:MULTISPECIES: zinc ABC transporter substrate-binding protein [unclassified Pseudonocardia]|jgi:zinc/manganese transport system substrate-binding protein|uniref:metal ABC transporter solute-binding protein, Zn/Mn family n=1 Tax=unclassified Pseudonocardia TaxID=2619320 RepID=UPI000A67BCE6|nr:MULTISPECIES: zinc ABC transporter substrate-binding protein [unclassified Pseudonocardia]MBN9100532.1 zinc ABC transporter substrate-binding protein [Pseudonocardia sp.]
MYLRRAILTPALAATAALTLTACGSSTAVPASGPATLSVVASTDVYGAIAQAIGGDAVTVTSIINSPDADPHEYETRPTDAVAVNEAKVVIYNGAGYDDFVTKLLGASSTKPATIDVSALSGLETAGTPFNEHVWYSLPTVTKLADRLAADLTAADPARASTFSANAAAFDQKVGALTAKLAAIRAKYAGQKVAITEPVPLYLVQDAGLVDVTPPKFSEAVEAGTDPPAAVLAATLATFQGADKVKVLLPNAQTETPLTKQVEQAATAGGVPIVPVTETLPTGVTDYVAWMTHQIDGLGSALGGV